MLDQGMKKCVLGQFQLSQRLSEEKIEEKNMYKLMSIPLDNQPNLHIKFRNFCESVLTSVTPSKIVVH